MSRKRWLQREKIKAVHDDDLEQFLSSLGVLEQIKEGEHLCTICGTPITLENFGAIYPRDNKICFLCHRAFCLANFNQEDRNE
jgi:hypothetical protein